METTAEVIKRNNLNNDKWAIFADDKYCGSIVDARQPEIIAAEIAKNAKRQRYEIKIGSIIIH
jgi:hypothetical protein